MENKFVYSNTNSARDIKEQPRKNISGISIRSDNKDELYPTLGGIGTKNFNNFGEDNIYNQYKNNMWNSPGITKKENPIVKKSENDSNVMEMTATMKYDK